MTSLKSFFEYKSNDIIFAWANLMIKVFLKLRVYPVNFTGGCKIDRCGLLANAYDVLYHTLGCPSHTIISQINIGHNTNQLSISYNTQS